MSLWPSGTSSSSFRRATSSGSVTSRKTISEGSGSSTFDFSAWASCALAVFLDRSVDPGPTERLPFTTAEPPITWVFEEVASVTCGTICECGVSMDLILSFFCAVGRRLALFLKACLIGAVSATRAISLPWRDFLLDLEGVIFAGTVGMTVGSTEVF